MPVLKAIECHFVEADNGNDLTFVVGDSETAVLQPMMPTPLNNSGFW
ncbi:MAG: hypothetical protein GY803_01765 [Chloroflexi bacterium]|nr:hypothetical protein [Chloroflexota bacterium]